MGSTVGGRVATTTGGALGLATGNVVVGDSVVGGYVVGDSVVGESLGDMGTATGVYVGSISDGDMNVVMTSSVGGSDDLVGVIWGDLKLGGGGSPSCSATDSTLWNSE